MELFIIILESSASIYPIVSNGGDFSRWYLLVAQEMRKVTGTLRYKSRSIEKKEDTLFEV